MLFDKVYMSEANMTIVDSCQRFFLSFNCSVLIVVK